MSPEEAMAAIERASEVFVHVVTSTNHEGEGGHSATFRIAKAEALAAIRAIDTPEFRANVHVSEGGSTVIIGAGGVLDILDELARASAFSHNDNNNGNF